jgi:hypothetical protein
MPAEELKALHEVAERRGQSVAQLVREAVRATWLMPTGQSIVGLAESTKALSSDQHDAIYDEL